MVSYLTQHEGHVISAFYHALNTDPCAGPNPAMLDPGCWKSHPLAKEALARHADIVMLDVGSNSGFYTQMMASMGYNVMAFDPQPQCVQFATAAAALNGFPSTQVRVTNAFVSNTASGTTSVSARSGCFGTFPLLDAAELRAGKAALAALAIPDGKDHVDVPHMRLDDVLDASTAFVPFMKIDTEGHEKEVFAGADALLRNHRVLTIMVEANKPTWKKLNRSLEEVAEVFQHLVSYGYTFKPNTDGNYDHTPPRDWSQPGRILSWLQEDWLVADIVLYLP